MSEKVDFIKDSDVGIILLTFMCEGAKLKGCEHDLKKAFNLPDYSTREVEVRLTVNGVEVPFTAYVEEIFSKFEGFVSKEANALVDNFFSESGLYVLRDKVHDISRSLDDLNYTALQEYEKRKKK